MFRSVFDNRIFLRKKAIVIFFLKNFCLKSFLFFENINCISTYNLKISKNYFKNSFVWKFFNYLEISLRFFLKNVFLIEKKNTNKNSLTTLLLKIKTLFVILQKKPKKNIFNRYTFIFCKIKEIFFQKKKYKNIKKIFNCVKFFFREKSSIFTTIKTFLKNKIFFPFLFGKNKHINSVFYQIQSIENFSLDFFYFFYFFLDFKKIFVSKKTNKINKYRNIFFFTKNFLSEKKKSIDFYYYYFNYIRIVIENEGDLIMSSMANFILGMKLLNIYFSLKIKNILKILQERSLLFSIFTFSKKYFFKYTFTEENFSNKNNKNYTSSEKTLKNSLKSFFFFRRKNKRFLKKIINFWKFPEIQFFLKTKFNNKLFFHLPNFIFQILKKLTILSDDQLISNFTTGQHSRKKKTFYFLKYFFNFHQQFSWFLKQIFILETEKNSCFYLLSSVKNFLLKLTEKVFEFILNQKKNQFIIFLITGSSRTNFNLISPFFQNLLFKSNKISNNTKNYPTNHLLTSLTNLILLADCACEIVIKHKKNFQIKKLKMKKNWSIFFFKSCDFFSHLKSEIFFDKKFKKNKHVIPVEIKIQKKKNSIKITQNSEYSALTKKQEILHSKMQTTETKRVISFISFAKKLINKHEKNWKETFESYFLPSFNFNVVIKFYSHKNKECSIFFPPNKIGCCINCYLSLFKYNFSIFKSGKRRKGKKSHQFIPDKKLFFLMKSSQLQHLLFCSFFFFIKQKFFENFPKKEKSYDRNFYRRKIFSFFLLYRFSKNFGMKKNVNSSNIIYILFVSFILKKYQYTFLKKNLLFFSKNIKKIFYLILKEKDPLVEKFIHEFKKHKNKKFKLQTTIEFKNNASISDKNSFLVIFLPKIFSNLNFIRLFFNETYIKKYFRIELKLKNFASLFSNCNFWLIMFHNLQKKSKRTFFFCIYFCKILIFYELFPFANLSKNKCNPKAIVFFSVLKKITFVTMKSQKKFSFKKICNILYENKSLFSKKFFSFLLNYLFVKCDPMENFLVKKSLCFFSSFYWFLVRKKKKKTTHISKKKIYILLNDLIENNKKGDLVIFCLLLNLNFVKLESIKDKIFNYGLEIITNRFFFLENKICYRKNFIIKNCFIFIKNFIKRKFFFLFNKSIYLIIFLKFLWTMKKNFMFFFFQKDIKKKKIMPKNFPFFSIIGKNLESGFFGSKTRKFLLVHEIQMIIKIEKKLVQKILENKILEFFVFCFRFLSVNYLLKLIHLLKNLFSKTKSFKKCFLNISNCFFSYIPYMFRTNGKYFFKKKNIYDIQIKTTHLFFSLNIPQIINLVEKKIYEKKFFFNHISLYSTFYYVFLKNAFNFFSPLFFLVLKKKFTISTKFKRVFHRIMFNLGLKIKTKQISIWIPKSQNHFLIQKFYLEHFPYFFKGLFLNTSLNSTAVFFLLESILNFILKFLRIFFPRMKRKEKVNVKKNFIDSLFKIIALSAFFFLNFFDYLWKSFFLNLISTEFFEIHSLKTIFFREILSKVFSNKQKQKNLVIFWKKTILSLNSRYNFALEKKLSRKNFIRKEFEFIQKFTLFLFSECTKTRRKNFIKFFFTFFQKNFFFGNTHQSVKLFLNLSAFIKTTNFHVQKYFFYFFYVCCSRFFFLIKTNNEHFISDNHDILIFIFYSIFKLPFFFCFKEIDWLKIIGIFSKNNILSENSKKQLIGLNILKKFTLSKIFPFDFLNYVMSSLFVFLKTTLYDIRFCSNLIFVHYFSNIKPDYKKFKVGLILFIRCLYLKRINSKVIFYEIFLNLSFNSSKKFLNIFSKLIFPKLFFHAFVDFGKISSYYLGLILKIFFLNTNKENFFYQSFKIHQKGRGGIKWFLIRIDMLWRKFFLFSTEKQASFQIEGLFQFMNDSPNIVPLFSKKEWDIEYFFNLMKKYLFYQNDWVTGIPLFYQMNWVKFFRKIYSNFFWIENKKIKFIKFFFFNLSDSNILFFRRFVIKFFSYIFSFLNSHKSGCFDFFKNKRQILYEIFLLKHFYPSLEKKTFFSFQKKSSPIKILILEKKIFYFYDLMNCFESILKKSFHISIFNNTTQTNTSPFFLRNSFNVFYSEKHKKEVYFLKKIRNSFKNFF